MLPNKNYLSAEGDLFSCFSLFSELTLTSLQLNFHDAAQWDLHIGAAEEADSEADVGLGVAIDADDLGFAVGIVEVFDANVIADLKACGCEIYFSAFLRQHLLKESHFFVREAGIFFSSFAPGSLLGWVAHQGGDVHHILY